ncbi:transcription factor bHLH147-like [Lycium barbarum]|uniref:transcription factor bHLH147-like n=1 Tax=Lycium barbarum TaxID=112863 RepID=UPI00293F0370|nr:transcription factor bHLH147-like [Lycium barbarum]XP_060215491.1 transcription factor bHLH147-like [Lycium barbarum]XP_060215492.1 transcription factor bHLH147-like [Lycium barbarum]
MASMLMKNPVTSSDRSIIARRKKKKTNLSSKDQNENTIINHNNNNNNNSRDSTNEWKSQAQQQVYSSKLLKALHHAQTSAPAPKGGQAVREVADRVLAATAKGRSKWSRAILTNRLKLKFMKKQSKRQSVARSKPSRLTKKPRAGIMLKLRTKSLPAFQKKARVLSRIVPGCQKQPLPVVLEEATDYIAALEMQVRAMSALADLLSGASSTS